MLLGVLFIICANWFNLYPAKIFRSSIDIVIETLNTYNLLEDSDFQKQVYEDLVKSLVFLGIALFALALIKGVFTFFMRYTIIMVSRFIEFDLKNLDFNFNLADTWAPAPKVAVCPTPWHQAASIPVFCFGNVHRCVSLHCAVN